MFGDEPCVLCNLLVIIGWVGILFFIVTVAVCRDCLRKIFNPFKKHSKREDAEPSTGDGAK